MSPQARHLILGAALLLGGAALWWNAAAPEAGREPPKPRPVVLATTTSVHDTGLLDLLLPQFTQQAGYPVRPIAVGSGQALAAAARGEVDLLLVHAPPAEEKFIAAGHGSARFAFAHNDFVVVGPPGDPAGARRASSVTEALSAILKAGLQGKARFVSRGDHSGTHQKELSLWKAAGLQPRSDPDAPWYVEAGVGQAALLHVAYQRRAYALTDRGTYLHLREQLPLAVIHEGDPRSLNPYSVVTINARRHKNINRAGAEALRRFLLSSPVQEQLLRFRKGRFGRPLFLPDALDAGPQDDAR